MDALALVVALFSIALSLFTLLIVFSISKNVIKVQEQVRAVLLAEPAASPKGWQVTYTEKGSRTKRVEYVEEQDEASVVRNLLKRGIDPARATITKNG